MFFGCCFEQVVIALSIVRFYHLTHMMRGFFSQHCGNVRQITLYFMYLLSLDYYNCDNFCFAGAHDCEVMKLVDRKDELRIKLSLIYDKNT